MANPAHTVIAFPDCGGYEAARAMTPESSSAQLTQESFDDLLRFLGEDSEVAGLKYEEVRQRLISIFIHKGSHEPERLADETINRVARRSGELAETYEGDPIRWFIGVARNVFWESVKSRPDPLPMPESDPPEVKEARQKCLDNCMDDRSPEEQQLILEYYTGEKTAKITHRKSMAAEREWSLNTLRIRAYRIRKGLQECVFSCMYSRSWAEMDWPLHPYIGEEAVHRKEP